MYSSDSISLYLLFFFLFISIDWKTEEVNFQYYCNII